LTCTIDGKGAFAALLPALRSAPEANEQTKAARSTKDRKIFFLLFTILIRG
jgi:hypothetical protein